MASSLGSQVRQMAAKLLAERSAAKKAIDTVSKPVPATPMSPNTFLEFRDGQTLVCDPITLTDARGTIHLLKPRSSIEVSK